MTGLVSVNDTNTLAARAEALGLTAAQYINHQRKLRQRAQERRAILIEEADLQRHAARLELKTNQEIKLEAKLRKISYWAARKALQERKGWRDSWMNMVRLAKYHEELEATRQAMLARGEDIFVSDKPVIRRPLAYGKIILIETASKYGITKEDITGPSRVREFIQARHEACYRLHAEAQYSFPEMGRLLGKRDHTTTLHSYNTYRRWQRIKAGKEAPRGRDNNNVDWDKLLEARQ